MNVTSGSDLILRIKDDKGNGIRVSNKASFFIRVFTTNPSNYIEYGKEDIVERNDYDTINIPADKLQQLESGVIAYTYGWSMLDDNFEDGEYNTLKTVYTNYYYQNNGDNGSGGQVSNLEMKDIRESIAKINEKLNAHTVTVQDNTLIITT